MQKNLLNNCRIFFINVKLFLSVQCYAWTEYKFRCVCVCVCVCVSVTLPVNSPTGETLYL